MLAGYRFYFVDAGSIVAKHPSAVAGERAINVSSRGKLSGHLSSNTRDISSQRQWVTLHRIEADATIQALGQPGDMARAIDLIRARTSR